MKYGITLWLLALGVFLGAVEVEIRPAQPYAGEVFQLLLTAEKNYPAPEKLPEVSGIRWMPNASSRSYRNINGKASHTLGISAVAEKAGTWQIPSFTVKTGRGKTAQTPVITLKVLADDSAESAADTRKALFGRIKLDEERTTCYLGEEVGLNVELFIRSDARVTGLAYPVLQIPHAVFRNYGQENPENPRFGKPLRRIRTVDGARYTVFSFPTAFRSIASGRITPEGAVTVEVAAPQKRRDRSRDPFDDDFFGGFFSSRQTVSRKVELTSPGQITFKPLPPVPADALFTGLVGPWQMEISLDRSAGCKVGEIMSLRLRFLGMGGGDLLKLPRIDLPGFRVYPPEIRKDPGGITATWQIIPLKAGKNRLKLRLATFDPQSGKYQISSMDQVLDAAPADRLPGSSVTAAPAAPVQAGTDPAEKPLPTQEKAFLLYLKKDPGTPETLPCGRQQLWLCGVLIAGGPLLWWIMLLIYARRDRIAGSGTLRRRRAARKVSKTLFRRLKHARTDWEWEDIFRREVPPVLADLLDLPPGSTAGELAEKVHDPVLKEALWHAGQNAYLPGVSGSGCTNRQGAMKALKKLLVFLLLPAGVYLSAHDFAAAGAAYDRGDFARAEAMYRQELAKRGPSAGLLYNLGCAAFMNEHPAAALAYFEGAVKLAPRDSAALENLNVTLARLGRDPVGRVQSPGDLLRYCRDLFRPDEWMVIGSVMWFCFFLILAFRRALPVPVRRTGWGITGVIFLLAVAACISQIRTGYAPNRGIVLDGGTRLRTLPAASGTLEGGLAPGQEVRILEERGAYLLIRCGNLQGWIPAGDCRRILQK